MNMYEPTGISLTTARCIQCGQQSSIMQGTPEFERALMQEPFVFICPACKQQNQTEALISRYTNLS